MQTEPNRITPPIALIVDDNWYNRDIVRMALEAIGFVTTEIDNGSTCLETLKERSFDLLVLDLQMPQVDGLTVLSAVVADPLHDKMRRIILTANPQMVTAAVTDKSDYVMYKPIDVMAFSRFAQRLFHSRLH